MVTPSRRNRRWKDLSTSQLQALYRDTVGRPTESDDRTYLIWKIRETEKGRFPIGNLPSRSFDGETVAITVKFEEGFLEGFDVAAEREGLSRLGFLRETLKIGLKARGLDELSGLLEKKHPVTRRRK